MSFYHKHLLINASVRSPLTDARACEDWFRELVNVIDMKILVEPKAKYCETEGNEGVTGTVVIETSHASIHIWSKADPAYLRMDVYSCKDFEVKDVVEFLDKTMDIIDHDVMVIDRNNTKLSIMQ
jgi:S-adenosylmethionine/arginine decarboxylase-like enzyme